MKKYYVKIADSRDAIADAPRAAVDEFRDGTPGYEPETEAAVIFIKNEGFLCRMYCGEKSPRAEEKNEDGPVHKDSCLEWFVNFAPEKGSSYMNLEANAAGTLHCKYGGVRQNRRPVAELGTVRPEAKAQISADGWSVEYFVSLETVKSLFGRDSFKPGDILRGNFYKCGDDTDFPHFGMWNRVRTRALDFHRPEYFGKLILTE